MNMQKLGTLGQSEKGFRNRSNSMNTGLRAIHYANISSGKVGPVGWRLTRHASLQACRRFSGVLQIYVLFRNHFFANTLKLSHKATLIWSLSVFTSAAHE